MYPVSEETLKNAHKPFDVVTNLIGDVGIIREVSVNSCQSEAKHQMAYAVKWLVGEETKCAWFEHSDLASHGNILIYLAELAAPNNKEWVKPLLMGRL